MTNSTPRDNLQCRIPKAAKESLARLCRFTERSQAKLIELAIRTEEQSTLLRMTEDERKRYLSGQLTVADIRARAPRVQSAELAAT
jgi:hypothetical protein